MLATEIVEKQEQPREEYRVERIQNISQAFNCLPIERMIRHKGRDRTKESDLMVFVNSQMQNPLFGFWLVYDREENIVGYTVAIISMLPGIKKMILMRMYAINEKVRKILENILRDWAKAFQVKLCQITVVKNFKVLQKRYKFHAVSVNMERRI